LITFILHKNDDNTELLQIHCNKILTRKKVQQSFTGHLTFIDLAIPVLIHNVKYVHCSPKNFHGKLQ